jgi:L-rhamnose isomerase
MKLEHPRIARARNRNSAYIGAGRLRDVFPRGLAGAALRFRLFRLARNAPKVALHIDAPFDDFDALGFKELALQAGVGLSNQQFPALAHDAMPGNTFAGRGGGHRVTGRPGATGQAQGSRERPIR